MLYRNDLLTLLNIVIVTTSAGEFEGATQPPITPVGVSRVAAHKLCTLQSKVTS